MMNVLKLSEGVYILNLKIERGKEFDKHSVCFNSVTREIIDNQNNIIVIEPSDLESSTTSYQIFRYLFPYSSDISLRNAYRIV